MQVCRQAGVPYAVLAPVLWRLAWSGEDPAGFAELRELARRERFSGRGLTSEEREELRASVLADCAAATEKWKRPASSLPGIRAGEGSSQPKGQAPS